MLKDYVELHEKLRITGLSPHPSAKGLPCEVNPKVHFLWSGASATILYVPWNSCYIYPPYEERKSSAPVVGGQGFAQLAPSRSWHFVPHRA